MPPAFAGNGQSNEGDDSSGLTTIRCNDCADKRLKKIYANGKCIELDSRKAKTQHSASQQIPVNLHGRHPRPQPARPGGAVFFFGLFAAAVRSNLEVPPAIASLLALSADVNWLQGASVLLKLASPPACCSRSVQRSTLAFVIPAYSCVILRRRLNAFVAAAVAATYGSVSAVTFIAANSFIEQQGV